MNKSSRNSANGAFVSVGSSGRKGGSVLQEIRRPDGSKVVGLNRDTYDRALSNAKSVLTKK
jgi:hypothetical protein